MTWRLAAGRPTEIRGRFWRMLAPRWAHDPLSGAGAARAGGRWNAPGQQALYLSDSHAAAIAEYQQALPRPGTLTGYDVGAPGLLDLTDPAMLDMLGLTPDFLRLPWKRVRDIDPGRPQCWDFATQAASHGWAGLRVPSVQAPGRNLVFWRWNEAEAPMIRHLDPFGDLPAQPTFRMGRAPEALPYMRQCRI